jgi:tRNA splicing ligase
MCKYFWDELSADVWCSDNKQEHHLHKWKELDLISSALTNSHQMLKHFMRVVPRLHPVQLTDEILPYLIISRLFP